ncbi:hypothetical protein [Klebsiella quasipneumoniae]|uniref:hypothetical protein n=1 Tax=Klebsiella quasipneumoniae TaxID=1463165 RepID=UPI0021ABE4E2|nr:hypothetical protein [Klebsiella quasipneumoniae]UVG22376.1 hypothetical protein NWT75_08075 [Klebsiella quasipneumoniae]
MVINKKTALSRFIFISLFCTIFIILYSLGWEAFPGKYWNDAAKVKSFLDNPFNIDGSFKATASLLYVGGEFSASVITIVVAILFIFIISKITTTYKGIFVSSYVVLPCIILNLLWPAKETIVVGMSIIIYFLYYLFVIKKNSFYIFIFSLVFIYSIYSYYFRVYYFLVLFVFLLMCLLHYRFNISILLSCFIVVVLFAILPSFFYIASQGQRDTANSYADLVGSDNRTAFNNIVPPGPGINYIINLSWAAAHLFFPVLYFRDINEFILLLYNLFFFITLKKINFITKKTKNSKLINKKYNVLLLLYLSHLYVQVLFEPDIGSYFRHILSVFVYLVPSLFFIFTNANKVDFNEE